MNPLFGDLNPRISASCGAGDLKGIEQRLPYLKARAAKTWFWGTLGFKGLRV